MLLNLISKTLRVKSIVNALLVKRVKLSNYSVTFFTFLSN